MMATPKFTESQHQLVSDYEFCKDHAEEFQVLGRFSITCVMRTVAALNPKATRKEFIQLFGWIGLNKKTLAIQFAKSRKFDVAVLGKVLKENGSFEE